MSLDIILKHNNPKSVKISGSTNFGALSKNTNEEPKGAILLFHGLTGSPFELQKYARFLYNSGYDVYAQCLPGHGDNFQDIYTITYEKWIAHSEKRFRELKRQYKNVFVSGICLGAVLALNVAIKYPNEVSGVVALSTTLYLDGWRLPWFMFLMPVALSTMIRFYYCYPECEPHGIKNEKTRAAVRKLLEKGDVGMNDFPMTAIYELLKLSGVVRRSLKSIVSPILLIHSKEDDLTSVKSANLVYKKISSIDKELITLNNSYHMVLYDNEKEYVFNKTLKFFDLHIDSEQKTREEVCI